MAIEIGPIAKPQIWLEGSRVQGASAIEDFAGRVDMAKHESVTSMNTIYAVTEYDETDILTFDRQVRIIITGQVSRKYDYVTANTTLPTASNVFEGEATDSSLLDINYWAQTYFTINGKDPVRTKAYLWKYKDMDNFNDPAGTNYEGLGFILGSAQTGSDLITIKARTFFGGNKSRISVVKFKIARQQPLINVTNGVPVN